MAFAVFSRGNSNVATSTTTIAANAATNSGGAIADIIKARQSHDVWVNGAYKTSNAELYNILASCLDAYNRMAGKHEQIAAFKAECELKGIKFKKTTPMLARIVAYVFGTDRRRVSGYARVLMRAYADKVDPATLHTWLADAGGVEEVRAKASGGMTTAQRSKVNARAAIASAPALKAVAKVANAGLQMQDADTPYVTALARVTANGTVEVLTFITDEHVVKATLAAYGSKLTADKRADARLNAAVSTANAIANVQAA